MRRGLSPVILVLAVGLVVGATPAPAPQQAPRPNLILTDDLDTASLGHLPRLQALLSAQGTTFANFFVSLALCCPSRASLLRAQYAHNTQIFTNAPPAGGFQDFRALGQEDSTVATWLHDAGYRTVLLGKYLNGYPAGAARTHVPPGWDEWYGVVGARTTSITG